MKQFTKQLIFISLGVAILAVGGVLIFAVGDKGAAPVAHWKLNEGSGNYAYDSSGNANTGTLYLGGSATSSAWVSGVYGGAMSFDGTDDYADAGNGASLQITGNLSVSAWIKTTDTAGRIIGKFEATDEKIAYIFNISSAPYLGVSGNGTSLAYRNLNGNALDNQWHHIAGVYNATAQTISMYLDGVLSQGTLGGTVPASIYNSTGNVKMGYDYGGNGYLNGTIDDVRIYNYARTADQVRADYNDGKALYVGARAADCDVSPADCVNKGLVGYWDMSQMGGQTASDKSGNGNNGTLGASASKGTDDPTWAQGIQPFSGGRPGGGGLSFDGVNDYVDAGNNIDVSSTNAITISAWVYPKANTVAGTIITQRDTNIFGQFILRQSSAGNGKIEIFIIDTSSRQTITNLAPTLNQWTLITAVWDKTQNSGKPKIYFNSVEQTYSIQTAATGVLSTKRTTIMGIRSSTEVTNLFNGLIDDVRIYNRALSAAEISYQYNQAKPIAQWKFDEGSGNYAYDSSANANTGSLNLGGSATSSAWVSGAYGGAMSFDGTDDYVAVSNSISMATGTLSFWAKPNTTTQKLVELSASDYVSLASGVVTVAGFGTEIVYVDGKQTTTFPDTNWHHIEIVSSASITANTVNLGKNSATYYNGLLDDIRIYNYAHTADQVRADYNNGKALYVGARAADCDVSPADCVNKGLVGYWDMSQMGGQTVADKSGNANTGTLGASAASGSDDPRWASGIQPFSGGRPGGGALSFDGVDDLVSFSSLTAYNSSSSHSYSAWIKPGVMTSYRWIINNGSDTQGTSLILYSGKIGFFYAGGRAVDVGNTTLIAGRWYHIVAVYDGNGNINFYLNGAGDGVQTTDATYSSWTATNSNPRLGSWTDGSYDLDAVLDDIRIYNRALSAAEISYQYNQAKPIAWWKMDEGADTATTCNATISSVYDYSGNANTGTLQNANASPATSSMWSDGKYGCALTLDGTDDYVALGTVKYNNIGTGDFTFSAWVNPTSFDTTNNNYITDNAGTNRWIIGSTNVAGAIKIYSLNAGAWTTAALATTSVGVWSHLEIARRSGVVYGYLNGAYQASANFNYSISHTGVSTIGSHNAGAAAFWSGSIDDARMYNYARTADQIRADYNGGAGLHLGQ
ncbi:MAG: LamG domain-containing protein [bacterium]|nr:LamG domain-containing protein [bacterium]